MLSMKERRRRRRGDKIWLYKNGNAMAAAIVAYSFRRHKKLKYFYFLKSKLRSESIAGKWWLESLVNGCPVIAFLVTRSIWLVEQKRLELLVASTSRKTLTSKSNSIQLLFKVLKVNSSFQVIARSDQLRTEFPFRLPRSCRYERQSWTHESLLPQQVKNHNFFYFNKWIRKLWNLLRAGENEVTSPQ